MTEQLPLFPPRYRHLLLWAACETACGQPLTPFETLILQTEPSTTPLCPSCEQAKSVALNWAAEQGYGGLSPADALLLRKKLVPAGYFWKRRWGPTPDEDPDWVKANYLEFNLLYEEVLDHGLYNLALKPKKAHRKDWKAASDNSSERCTMHNGH